MPAPIPSSVYSFIKSCFMRALLGLSLAFSPLARAADPDLARIQTQIAERLIATPAAKDLRFMGAELKPQGVADWMQSIAPDGSWPDIRYEDKTVGAWSPTLHLSRVVEMAKVFASPSDKLHGAPALLAAIHSALGYWFVKDFHSPNWFHNEIRVPQYMAYIMIMMDANLTAEERTKALAIVARSGIRLTGQNRVWLAGNVLMRGVLQNNPALVQQAREAISDEIVVTDKEGLQADNSFHQHGAQLQSGAYGLSFATDSLAWISALRGTRMAFGEDKVAIVRDYALQGLNFMVWNGMMDTSAAGRALFPGNMTAKAGTVRTILSTLGKSDLPFAPAYQKALRSYDGHTAAEDQITGNKFFWRSDYMVDRRPGYFASVKMSSKRVIGTELINKENLSGALLGDGALYLYKTGREYEDIFPVWDWRKLPGVTAAQKGKVLPLRPQNTAEFVGGVTDGTDGVAVLDYDRKSLMSRNPLGMTAKKSWFFFDGQIVCLGAGITTELVSTVATSVNQCLLNGPVSVGHDNQAETLPPGRKDYAALQWAWHDGIGYVFPQPAKVTVGGAEQKGSWQAIYVAGSTDPVAKQVFSLWIDHGMTPRDASYAYVILPVASEAQVKAYSKTLGAVILDNTAKLQAVRCGPITAGVFYEPGQLAYAPGKQLAVAQPSLVMIKVTPQGTSLTVADPTQKLTELEITLNGKSVKIPLPAGPEAGRSVTIARP